MDGRSRLKQANRQTNIGIALAVLLLLGLSILKLSCQTEPIEEAPEDYTGGYKR